MSEVVSLLIEALVGEAGDARQAKIEAAHMRSLAETRAPAPSESAVSVAIAKVAIENGWNGDGDALNYVGTLLAVYKHEEEQQTRSGAAPTIARVYLVKMAMRMRKAAQVLKRGRNAELSADLADSADVVEKFLRDTK